MSVMHWRQRNKPWSVVVRLTDRLMQHIRHAFANWKARYWTDNKIFRRYNAS